MKDVKALQRERLKRLIMTPMAYYFSIEVRVS